MFAVGDGGEFFAQVAGGDLFAGVVGFGEPEVEQLEDGVVFEDEGGLFTGQVVQDVADCVFDAFVACYGKSELSKVPHAERVPAVTIIAV